MKPRSEHWNRIFRETPDEKMGWHENDPTQTLRLLNRIPGWESSTLFLPGAGTSVLIDVLLEAGAQLVLNDISQEALDRVEERLGDQASDIEWLCQDIIQPLENKVAPIDVWIDRAVLHFITEADDIEGYFKNVFAAVKVGGHALFAEFPPHGAPTCAGLDLHRYSIEELSRRLGSGFTLIEHFDHIYTTPAGDPRPYIYALYERVG
jgi:ubiquinone/menaquinone biosynthesis C-methylase UbiE